MAKRRAFMLSASQYMQQVRLPPEFISKSRALADNLLKDAVHRYHAHRHERHSRVDTRAWKLVKDKHGVACYRGLQAKQSSANDTSSPPEVMAVGMISGTVDDVLHGVVNLTPEAMHIENALAQSDLIDSRILAFLSPPTSSDPFDAMTVKWVLRNHASMAKQRDYVYLEASGMTTAPDGEQLGFILAHSVTLAAVPEFRKDSHISRGQLSYCYLFRQARPHGVDVFFKGSLNPAGGVKDRVSLALTVDMVLGVCPSSVQLAMMKKLMFCLQTLPAVDTQDRNSRSRSSQSSHSSNNSSKASVSGRSRSLGSNGSFLRRLTSFSTGSASSADEFRRSSIISRVHSQSLDSADLHASNCEKCNRHFNALKTKAKCQLCAKVVCSRCRVIKRVIAFEDSVMFPEKLDFCTDCIANTNNTSAAWIAAQELHDLELMIKETEAENDMLKANADENRASKVRKPLWELTSSIDDRQTMSSEFSTRSSTGSRYLVRLTGNGTGLEDVGTSRGGALDLQDGGLADVDEDLSASGMSRFGGFVTDDYDDDDDDEEETPIVESFVDDDFLFDESDEIFFSVKEEEVMY